MVTRVYGLANGEVVIFSHADGNAWEITVPWSDDGRYTAEIFAEDEAGNTAHLCSMLFVITGHELRACIIPNEKQAVMDGKTHGIQIRDTAKELDLSDAKPVEVEVLEDSKILRLKEGGYQVERIICERSTV